MGIWSLSLLNHRPFHIDSRSIYVPTVGKVYRYSALKNCKLIFHCPQTTAVVLIYCFDIGHLLFVNLMIKIMFD